MAANIEQFDEMVGKVLGYLYQGFPTPAYLNGESVGLSIGERVMFLDSSGQSATIQHPGAVTDEELFFGHTVRWLQTSGYLQFSGNYGSTFASVILTSKGLEVLKAVPESLQGGLSLGDQLSSATKTGAVELLRAIASEALAIGSKALMGS